MKARIKATGEIVEVMYSTEMGVGTSNGVYLVQDLEEIESDYWTRLEHTYAGMAMQGFISSKRGLNIETDMYDIPYYSQMLAHALVEKLKEKEERK